MNSFRKLLLVTIALPAFALVGCGRSEKSQITDAINESIKDSKAQFSIREKKIPNWPLKIDQLSMMLDSSSARILEAMQAAGYIRMTQEVGGLAQTYYVITPTEEAKKWWDPQDGFCVGKKAVVEVQEWTLPGKESGMPMQVKYTWQLADVPSWAKRPEFKEIPGMATPVEGHAMLQQTNNGWKSL